MPPVPPFPHSYDQRAPPVDNRRTRLSRTWQHGGVTAATHSSLFPRTRRRPDRPAVDADAVLDGLDPEQREVGDGPARPGVRAGRRRYGQDPRDHPPHRVRGARRAFSSPPACWPSPSPTAPRARCGAGCASSAPAASRPGRSTRPRCASSSTSGPRRSAASCRGCWSARSSSSPRRRPAAGSGSTATSCATSRARSSGRRSPRPCPPTTRPRSPRPAATPRATRPRSARSTRRTSSSSATASVIDFEDVLLLTVGMLQDRHDIAEQVRAPVPALRRRRVPGRQPAPAAAARPVARRPGEPLRRRRRQPDDLLLHRRHPGPPAQLPHPPSRTRRW